MSGVRVAFVVFADAPVAPEDMPRDADMMQELEEGYVDMLFELLEAEGFTDLGVDVYMGSDTEEVHQRMRKSCRVVD